MARTRSFDIDTVLATAANIFRQRGYKDVSIKELEEATGLVSGSIYNAFGDKAGLFKAALHHYIHVFVHQRLAAFAGEDARLEELEGLFLSVLEPPLADGYGCLVNNSIIEFGSGGDMASAAITETLAMMRDGIGTVLRRELGSRNAEAATMHLMLLYHGSLTLSRSGTSFDEMARAIKSEFDRLKQLRARAAAVSPRIKPL